MDDNKMTASISIDIKKGRIRIHRATLAQLGLPKYIQLLVNPREKVIAIRGLDERCKEAHVVSFSHMRNDYSYELYSKQLVNSLISLCPDIEIGCTYKLTGEVYTEEKVVFFPLDSLQKYEGGVLIATNGTEN